MRGLIPWNPYQELVNWHRDIDDLFRRFFSEERREEPMLGGWMPALEAFEKDGRYVVRADLPGVNPSDLDISVINDTLVVKGERKRSEEVKEKDYHYRETAYGRFERRLPLPQGTDRDKVTARFENGVLEISVPLPEAAKAKKIPIETGPRQEMLAAA